MIKLHFELQGELLVLRRILAPNVRPNNLNHGVATRKFGALMNTHLELQGKLLVFGHMV